LAGDILRCFPAMVETLHEPFAGSAAISLAAAAHRLTLLRVLSSDYLRKGLYAKNPESTSTL
jgi:site-specific DNA-adenine methylase